MALMTAVSVVNLINCQCLRRYVEKIVASQKFTSTEPLDMMKFICKEFWEEIFKRKVRSGTIYEVNLKYHLTLD